jgi:hypothetical protein
MAWGSKKQSLIAEMISINPKLNEQDLMKLTRNQLRGRLYMLKKYRLVSTGLSECLSKQDKKSDFNTKIDALISEAKEQGMWLEPRSWKRVFV